MQEPAQRSITCRGYAVVLRFLAVLDDLEAFGMQTALEQFAHGSSTTGQAPVGAVRQNSP
jgi:hypothetical protein